MLREYPEDNGLSSGEPEESRDLRLIITSVTKSIVPAAGEDEPSDGAPSMPVMAQAAPHPRLETERVESRTVGTISRRAGRIVLCYEDACDEDEPPVPTELSFAVGEPGLITLERRGFVRTTMIFEARARHRATYRTPIASFDMTVYTRAIENALGEDGGTVRLEYAVEFRGAAEQLVEITIDAAPL